MDLVLSTSWNAAHLRSGKKLIFEIKELGFRQVELSFNLTSKMVQDIGKLVKTNQIQVVSLHNFCPIPQGVSRRKALPDYYSLSSLDDVERKSALKQTKNTISICQQLGARAVVLHCGRVEIPDQTRALIGLYEAGKKNSFEFIALSKQIISQRQSKAGPFFENILKSLDELNKYAQEKKISLGVETRFYYREIPSFKEIGIILDEFKGGNIFYWHDTGHAEVMDRLGIIRHEDLLRNYGSRMLGVHLHDVVGCKDHHAPGKGNFNFSLLKPYIKQNTLKVIEAHWPSSAEDLIESKRFIENVFCQTK